MSKLIFFRCEIILFNRLNDSVNAIRRIQAPLEALTIFSLLT